MPFLAICGPFFYRFRPAWSPLTGQNGRFSDTSQIISGTVLAFLSVPEGLNHLGSPGNTEQKCHFWPFFGHFGRFGPAWRPLTGQHGRFSDTSQANSGTVVAFLSVPESLNHLGSPGNTDISPLRVDLTPTSHPRKYHFWQFFGHFGRFGPLNPFRARFGPKIV